MSSRQDIVTALETLLEAIPSFSGRVFTWRRTPVRPTECPCVLIMDRDRTMDAEASTLAATVWQLMVELEVLAAGSASAVTCWTLLDAIAAAVEADPTLGGTAIIARVMSDRMDLEHDEQILGGMGITLQVTYS